MGTGSVHRLDASQPRSAVCLETAHLGTTDSVGQPALRMAWASWMLKVVRVGGVALCACHPAKPQVTVRVSVVFSWSCCGNGQDAVHTHRHESATRRHPRIGCRGNSRPCLAAAVRRNRGPIQDLQRQGSGCKFTLCTAQDSIHLMPGLNN